MQARVIAEVLQRVAPDVLLINEFDYDAVGIALRLFDERYLRVAWNGASALRFALRATGEHGRHQSISITTVASPDRTMRSVSVCFRANTDSR
jgi:hypothetical protein